ncbi:unnamed protein product [Camellia sinensis]
MLTFRKTTIGNQKQHWKNMLYYDSNPQKSKAPMPWIGMYVAAASLICFLTIVADAFYAFRNKKFWFPCKFFTINAATLTLLGVTMKMPLDVSSDMYGGSDQLAKLSSTVMKCIAIGNFMPSLGPMDDKDIFTNIIALVSTFSAVTVATAKKYLELKYSEIHKEALREQIGKKITVEKLKENVNKYWMMAKTGSPQFMMARSVTYSASGVICLMTALILAQLEYQVWDFAATGESDYTWSTFFIFVIQTATVGVGIIGPICRWFTAIKFKCSKESTKGFKTELKPKSYWIKRLEEWKKSSTVLQIRGLKLRKLVQRTKNLALNLCIMIQPVHNSTSPTKSDNVLLLEGEVEFTESTLKNISKAAGHFIIKANKQQRKNLIELLQQKSTEFVRSVSEGLSHVKHVDETVDIKGNLANSRDAADKVWLGVELEGKWLDEDLTRIAPKETSCRETFQIVADFAQKIVIKYKANINASPVGNPTNWPINVVAANSMYKICKSLLLDAEGNNHQINDDELFLKLFDMIAGILGACLTNLPGVITMKCFSSAIEKREENVRFVAQLLGETEKILKFFGNHELLYLHDTDQFASIDEWHAKMGQASPCASPSSSDNNSVASGSGELAMEIELEA